MFTLIFKPWRKFTARKRDDRVLSFMERVATGAEDAFRSGMTGGHSGRRGRVRQASAPGEYPASQTGALLGSIRSRANLRRVDVGTSAAHAVYLRYGTRKMARRKMSDDALKEGIEKARSSLTGWVEWNR